MFVFRGLLRHQCNALAFVQHRPYLPLHFTAGKIIARLVFIKAGDSDIEIPRSKIQLAFSRSSGAGGQNVNKVSTKAELRFHVASADWLDAHTKERLTLICRNQLNREGELVITSQRLRTQEGNLEDAFAKLEAAVREAASIPKVRTMRTGLSELSKAGYREDKRQRSEVKARRRPPRGGDDD